MTPRPALLVIAGHDPSDGPLGFAGVRADREGAGDAVGRLTGDPQALDLRTVVTAWTDQDDLGVRSIGARPASEWLAEARHEVAAFSGSARTSGEPPVAVLRGVKVGLLASVEHVESLALLLRELRARDARLPIVIDPVLASSSGTTFLDAAGRAALLSLVLPLGVTLTPNLPEAAALAGGELPQSDLRRTREALARTLLARGARAVVLKGGHGQEDPLQDLVLEAGSRPHWLEHPRLQGSMRGTGCRFASALAAARALETPFPKAARIAAACVASRLELRSTPQRENRGDDSSSRIPD